MGLENLLYGASSFLDTTRSLQDYDRQLAEHKQQLANQEADRRRQIAMDNYKVAQAMAPGMLQAGQYEGAAKMLNDSLGELRAAGFNVSNNGVMGAAKQVHRPSAAPAAGPFAITQAPQPGKVSLDTPLGGAAAMLDQRFGRLDGAPANYSEMMTRGLNPGDNIGGAAPVAPESVTVRDFNNPQTKAAIYGGFGLQTPQPKTEIRTLGNGGYVVITQHPDGRIEYDEHKGTPKAAPLVATDNGDGTVTYVPKAEGTTVKKAPPKARSGGGSGRPHFGWVMQPDGTKVYGELKPGTVSATPPKKDKPTRFNSGEAMREAELEAANATGIDPKARFMSRKDAQRLNAEKAKRYAAKKRQAQQGSSQGGASLQDKLKAAGLL